MSLDESLSRFIGGLYEAVYDPLAWRQATAEMLGRTGSQVALITAVDLEHREFSRADFVGPETSGFETGIREYDEEMHRQDPTLAWASANPAAGMCDSAAVIDKQDYLTDPFVVWNKSRFGTTHWRVLWSQPVDGFSFSLSLHPPAAVGAPSDDLRPLHRLIFDHMERALRLAARPPDFSRDSGAVIALDRHGRLIAMSDRARSLLDLADGMTLSDRRIIASCGESAARLDRSLHSAVNAEPGCATGGGVRLKRPSGKADWLAVVSPYPRFLDHLPFPAPAAVVRIIEPEEHHPLTRLHAELFGLTARELEVAEGLLRGHSIESLACWLGISANTARVHLQALFRKTNTGRQSELMRILAAVARH